MSIREKLKKSEKIVNAYDSIKEFYYKNLISDETIIRRKFKKELGRDLDLENPTHFNDKLQWLKLYWYDPVASQCADKYAVRDFVKERIGAEYLNELYHVYESVEEIDIEELPTSFVLKGTHGSGFNIICKDKHEMNWEHAFQSMRRWLNRSYYLQKGEWVYKDIKPRIVCEKYLTDVELGELRDYKVFCFNGEPKFLVVMSDHDNGTKSDFFDLDWNKMDVQQLYPNSEDEIPKPRNLNKLLELSKKLSQGFPQVRVDFYITGDAIIFGELTFYHASGTQKFDPEVYDEIFGRYLELPPKYVKKGKS